MAKYNYDAWGKLLSTTGSLASTIGKANPFLYRGYYVDSETGLYYLNSRYYDAQTGRMINADSIGGQVGDLNSHNIFAYCENNPINRLDLFGNSWIDDVGNFLKSSVNAFMDFRENNLREAEKIQIQGAIQSTNQMAEMYKRHNGNFDWEKTFYSIYKSQKLANQYGMVSGGLSVNGWIQRSTYAAVGERFGQKGQKAFANALKKGPVGKIGSGIKRLAPGTKVGGKLY